MKKETKIPSESQEQQRLVLKLRWNHSELEFFAIPNGGKRGKGEARKQVLEGVEKGTPDIFIAEPRGEFSGLFLELKRREKSKSKTSNEQIIKHQRLLDRGYQVKVCYGAAHAYKEILAYLNEELL